MGSSELIPKPVTKIRTSAELFYGRFGWCGHFHLPECGALRGLDHAAIDRTVSLRRRWGRRMISRPVGSWIHAWEKVQITDAMVEDLHAVCDFLLQDPAPRRIRIQEDNFYLYCDDPGLVDRVAALGIGKHMETIQIQLQGEPGRIYRRSSEYSLRSYLRQQRLTVTTAASVRGFLLAQQDVNLSPSLAAWADQQRSFLQGHYFFDHHSPATTQMLDLIHPGLVKSTLPIVADK